MQAYPSSTKHPTQSTCFQPGPFPHSPAPSPLVRPPRGQAPDPRDQPDSRSPAVICTMRSCARWNPPLSASHCFLFKPHRGSGPCSPPHLRILADPELPHVAPQGTARPRLLGTGRSKPSSDRPGDDQTLSSSGSSHLSPVEGRCRAPAKRGAGSRF